MENVEYNAGETIEKMAFDGKKEIDKRLHTLKDEVAEEMRFHLSMFK